MKTMKKLMAVVMVLALGLLVALPALATDTEPTYEITMNSPQEGHVYKVYQVFTGDLSSDGKLSNVVYGNSGYGTEGQAVPAEELEELAENGAETFAKDHAADMTVDSGELNAANNYKLSGLAAGYYLIKDMTENVGTGDSYSAYMVEVVGNVNITPKADQPTLDKTVQDGENWSDVADHNVGETFQFQLTAALPGGNLALYDSYKLVFTDTMSAGITFENIDSVMVGGTRLTAEQYTANSVTAEDTGITTLTVEIADVVPIAGEAWGTAMNVVVTYNAHLNEKATMTNADGPTDNANGAKLTYSNDPTYTGDPAGTPTGDTTEDKAFVYTFKLDGTKKINSADGDILAGAGFTLYQGDTALQFVLVNGIYVLYSEKVFPDATEEEILTEIVSAEGTGEFNFAGLAAGDYVLKESTTPQGYNTCPDKTITIEAVLTEDTDVPNADITMTTADVESESIDGENTTPVENLDGTALTIINKSGATLPSTGGIGTTIFYVVGGVLVVGAGVLLFAKRRMSRS